MAVSADQRAILEEIRVNLAGLQAELRKMSDNMRDNLSKMVATCNGIINTCSSISKSVMVSDDGITEVDTSLDVEAKDIDSLEKVVHSKDGQIGDALNLFDEMLLRLAPQEKDAYWHSINSSSVISIKVIATNDSITPTFESTSTNSVKYQLMPLLLYLDELNKLRPPNSGDFPSNSLAELQYDMPNFFTVRDCELQNLTLKYLCTSRGVTGFIEEIAAMDVYMWCFSVLDNRLCILKSRVIVDASEFVRHSSPTQHCIFQLLYMFFGDAVGYVLSCGEYGGIFSRSSNDQLAPKCIGLCLNNWWLYNFMGGKAATVPILFLMRQSVNFKELFLMSPGTVQSSFLCRNFLTCQAFNLTVVDHLTADLGESYIGFHSALKNMKAINDHALHYFNDTSEMPNTVYLTMVGQRLHHVNTQIMGDSPGRNKGYMSGTQVNFYAHEGQRCFHPGIKINHNILGEFIEQFADCPKKSKATWLLQATGKCILSSDHPLTDSINSFPPSCCGAMLCVSMIMAVSIFSYICNAVIRHTNPLSFKKTTRTDFRFFLGHEPLVNQKGITLILYSLTGYSSSNTVIIFLAMVKGILVPYYVSLLHHLHLVSDSY